MTDNYAEITIATYDTSANQLAEFFKGIGSRVDDVELALRLADSEHPVRAIEIGCGDGRDAVEIVDRVDWYEGVDPSGGLLSLAQQKLPGVSFIHETVQNYEFPDDLDVVFAFASLLHLSREENALLFPRVASALRKGGIFFLSLKEADSYESRLQHDEYGDRMFYYYDADTIKQLAEPAFSVAYEDHQKRGSVTWLELALKRV